MEDALTEKVYDSFGDEYYSNKHSTIKYFNALQTVQIDLAIYRQKEYLDVGFDKLNILHIGVGNGQYWTESELTKPSGIGIHDYNVFGGRLKWDKIVDFDISKVMLETAKKRYPKEFELAKNEKLPQQIQGNAMNVSSYFNENSFDVVLAPLCDHVSNQNKMYDCVMEILKPGGIFVVTYPHKELMTIIRKDVYGINSNFTKFKIKGKEYLVPSLTPDLEELAELFSNSNFENVKLKAINHKDNLSAIPSDTVKKAQQISGKSLDELQILAFGVGKKPDNRNKWEKLSERDPWFFYN